MSIGRTALSTTVDDKGRFNFEDVPAGKIDLFVDGRTVNVQDQQYPALHFEATAVKGAQNQLPHPIYLPQLQMAEARIVGGDQDVILRMPGFEGYEMTVFANSVTFPDGSKTGPLVVSPISLDKLPMTPPGGFAGFMSPAATIQPAGTRFDPPLRIKIPNTAGFKPGEKKPVYQWDHDLATFVQMGQATVTEDGAFLITDPGTGISKAGWHPIPNPPPPDNCVESSAEPTCKTCNRLASSVGRCPKKSCEPYTGGECGTGSFCTINGVCKGGVCVGEKMKDKESATETLESNLAAFSSIKQFLTKVGILGVADSFKVALESKEVQHCCEAEKAVKTAKATKFDTKVSLGIGPYAVPLPLGLSGNIPIPPGLCPSGCLISYGLLVSAEFGAAVGFEKYDNNCTGEKNCWQGNGRLYVDLALDLGGAIRSGEHVLARLTGGGRGGFEAGIVPSCSDGRVAGIVFSGLFVKVVFELFDGAFSYNAAWPVPGAGPYPIPGFSFPLP